MSLILGLNIHSHAQNQTVQNEDVFLLKGKIDFKNIPDYMHNQECIGYETYYFNTDSDEQILISFENDLMPQKDEIILLGENYLVENPCTKGGSVEVMFVSNVFSSQKILEPSTNFEDVSSNEMNSNETGSNLSWEQANEALNFHNKVRNEVGVSNLIWSEDLASDAQEWADHLVNAGCKMEHRPSSGVYANDFGENIYKSSGYSNQDAALRASKAWYSEIEVFTYEPLHPDRWYPTGHYTQMVWHSTQKVGMAYSLCENGSVIVVANYDPPGNYMGETAY